MSKNKNVSKIIPYGRTLQTRDEYLEGGNNYIKPGYEMKGHYRRVVVVDTNRNNELAVEKLYGHNGKELPGYKNGKSRYKDFIVTKDNEGNPIKIGNKFIENAPKQDVSKKDVNKIKKDALVNASYRVKKSNRNKVRKLKNRK